jgi:hypothetical protein
MGDWPNNWEKYTFMAALILYPVWLFFMLKKDILVDIFEMAKKDKGSWLPW